MLRVSLSACAGVSADAYNPGRKKKGLEPLGRVLPIFNGITLREDQYRKVFRA